MAQTSSTCKDPFRPICSATCGLRTGPPSMTPWNHLAAKSVPMRTKPYRSVKIWIFQFNSTIHFVSCPNPSWNPLSKSNRCWYSRYRSKLNFYSRTNRSHNFQVRTNVSILAPVLPRKSKNILDIVVQTLTFWSAIAERLRSLVGE